MAHERPGTNPREHGWHLYLSSLSPRLCWDQGLGHYTVTHLPRAHIAAEGICMAATSSVQSTFINGHTDTAVPAPASVACAVVVAQVTRDTLSL